MYSEAPNGVLQKVKFKIFLRLFSLRCISLGMKTNESLKNQTSCTGKLSCLYSAYLKLLDGLQGVFLLLIRLYWGFQFVQTGYGKLGNIARVTEYFSSLGIPLPSFHAYLVASVELLGGIFLILGLFLRITALPLVITMVVAYLTADIAAVNAIFSDPDIFVKATPFPFLFTTAVVLLFGSGRFSIDRICPCFNKRVQCDSNQTCCSTENQREKI